LEAQDARIGVEQLVAHRERRHHGEARVADLAKLAAQAPDPRLKTLGEFQEPRLLTLFAGHAVLPAVDGDVDVAHELSPASSAAISRRVAASMSAAALVALSDTLEERSFMRNPEPV